MTLSLQPLFIFLRWLICVRNRLSSSRLDKCFHQARIHRSPPGALAFFSNSILAIFSLRPETQNACCPLVLVFWMQVTTSAGDGSWTGWFKLQCGKTDHSFSTSTVGPWRQKWLVIRKFSKYGFASKLSKQKPSSFFGDVWALIFKLPWQFHPGEKSASLAWACLTLGTHEKNPPRCSWYSIILGYAACPIFQYIQISCLVLWCWS